MNQPNKCPMCGSPSIDVLDDGGIFYVRCKKCPLNEMNIEEDVPDWINSRHDPFKTTFQHKKT